jgi:hypothetical protein
MEFEAATEHLRGQAILAWPLAALPMFILQLLTLDWVQDPENFIFSTFLALVAGASATVLAILVGFSLRLATRNRTKIRRLCLGLITVGIVLALSSLIATSNSPRNALGLAEERLVSLLVLGTLLIALGVTHWPRPERPGSRRG